MSYQIVGKVPGGGRATHLTEELLDKVDDAIESAMGQHEPLKGDSVCTCGVRVYSRVLLGR